MRLNFSCADPKMLPHACAVVERLQTQGYTAYFAGGCVRDALLERPLKDIDIATSATPDQVVALFPAQSVGVGKSFGVMLVVIEGCSFDVATFRTDGGYQDGRHPDSVVFSSAEHDAQRRDLTINGLFYDPIANQLHDYVGGLADLEVKCVRAIGEPRKRFQEDRLRMLRAIRFATSLDFAIDEATWTALCAEAPQLRCVSVERIYAEFTRTLCEAHSPTQALELLATSGLLNLFFPELLKLKGCLQDPVWHPEGDVWVHTTKMLEMITKPRDPRLVWSVLLHDIAKPVALIVMTKPDGSPWYRTPNHAIMGATQAEEILRRFKVSTAFADDVICAVKNHMQFVELPRMRRSNVRRVLGRPTIQLELELHRLDCLSSHAKLELYDFAQEQLAQFASEPILPKAFITGRDLLARGYTSGPAMGKLLKKLYTEQLNGATEEELLAHLRPLKP